MPDYRKKHRNRIFSSSQRGKRTATRSNRKSEDIKMTPSGAKRSRENQNVNMRVVAGKKLEQKRRFKLFGTFIAAVLIILLILQLILPAGIVQTVKNTIAVFGTGSYPMELSSSDTVDVASMGSYYYVLSDTTLSAFANSGKELFNYAHGFEFPILKTSRFGAILFNQGNNTALIFTTGGLEETVESEKNIITASISDSGSYALVTESDSYACAVSVYNKYGKSLYEWFSAEDVVNNIAIAPNNKKIAVSTFKTSGGKFSSKVQVLNFKSADAENTSEFDGLVYNLSNKASGRFMVVTSNELKFIKWSNQKSQEYKNDYDISMLRESYHGTVAVFGRESDPNDNKIAVFSKTGKLKYEFKFNGIISDIYLFGGHIYCMSDTELYLLDEEGKTLRDASIGFGVVRIVVTATNNVLTVTDNLIEKIKIEEEKSE